MGIMQKMKSKLRPATDAVKSVEKRAEKALQFKNPVFVNQMRNPAEKVTDTTPTPDPPNGQASGSSNAEPPKAQLVMEEVPKGPGGKQPKLGKLENVDAGPNPGVKAQKEDVKPTTKGGELGMTGGNDESAAKGGGSAVAAAAPPRPDTEPTVEVAVLPPTPDDKIINGSAVVAVLVVATVLFWVGVIDVLPPHWGEFSLYSLLVGLPAGLGLSFWKHKVKQHKAENIEKLNVYPGLKGLKELLGTVPSWIHYEEKERVDWLNSALVQMWPYYDAAISASVKETLEPIMDMYKPPGLIKKIYFRRLTFGSAPFKIDNVWIDRSDPNQVCLEMNFRWAGDANIAIAIEPSIAGTTLRMVPRVSDLRVSGTFRVLMKPLVDEIPVVAGVIVALKSPPEVHFNLSLGKAFGGALAAKPIVAWLDPFLRNTLADMLVWPNRIVVPLSYDPDFDYSVLEMRHVGLLTIDCVEAVDCKKMDRIGKSDPYLEVFTLALERVNTRVAHNTLTPVWDEQLHVLVQEPSTQMLRIEMFDHDLINVKGLLKVNPVQGIADTFNPGEFMGRCSININKFSSQPNQGVDDWYDMGKGDFSNPDGCGRGEGQVHLRIAYTPFEKFQRHPADSVTGTLLLRLVKAERLAARDEVTSDPYVTFTLKKGSKRRRSWVIQNTLEPVWNQKFEWLNILSTEVLSLEVFDDDLVGDELLGVMEFDIGAHLREIPFECREAVWHKAFPLQKVAMCEKDHIRPPSTLTLKMQWIPYTYADHSGNSPSQKQQKHGVAKLTGWMHRSSDKNEPAPSAAEALEGRGASFTSRNSPSPTASNSSQLSPLPTDGSNGSGSRPTSPLKPANAVPATDSGDTTPHVASSVMLDTASRANSGAVSGPLNRGGVQGIGAPVPPVGEHPAVTHLQEAGDGVGANHPDGQPAIAPVRLHL